MGPEPEHWDDYTKPDPRIGNRTLPPPTPTRADLDGIRAKVTQQEHIVAAIEIALETARNRLADLHKQHAGMLLADAGHDSDDPAKM